MHRSIESAAKCVERRSTEASTRTSSTATSTTIASPTLSYVSVTPRTGSPVAAPSLTTQQALDNWADVQTALPDAAPVLPAAPSPTQEPLVPNPLPVIDEYAAGVNTWYVVFVGRRIGVFGST